MKSSAPFSLDHGKAVRSSRASWAWRALAIVIGMRAQAALACPDCAVGRAARAQLWADGFALKLAALLLPFIVIIAASAWAERLGRRKQV